jgi:hypothetical protein
MPHLLLLGDSIFDNRAYTRGEPDVVSHLRALLPAGWRATLAAVDGSSTADVERRLRAVRADVTHVAVAVGGNDALMSVDLLDSPVASTREALLRFGSRIDAFERAYLAAMRAVGALRRPAAACTIYNGLLDDREAPAARVALMLFNDTILRVLVALGIDAIELRLVCTAPEDYANPIEPSGRGGRKIARAIAAWATDDAGARRVRVYAGQT